MQGLSKKEVEIISWLEFYEKYFFTSKEVKQFAKNKTQQYNIIKNLLRKERIIKLNRTKYYLVPIKAKRGKWVEDPYIIADEVMDSKDYFIGGWAAASFWNVTEQMPFQYDIWTTKRQGKIKIMNVRFAFHRTTKKRIKEAVEVKAGEHLVRILSRKESNKWVKSRQ